MIAKAVDDFVEFVPNAHGEVDQTLHLGRCCHANPINEPKHSSVFFSLAEDCSELFFKYIGYIKFAVDCEELI